MKTLIAAILITSVTPSFAASPVCGPREKMVQILADQYQERVVGRGLDKRKIMIEVFVSLRGTFSVVMTSEDGVSCLVAGGENWYQIDGDQS